MFKEIIDGKNLSIKDISEGSGIPRSTINDLAKGKTDISKMSAGNLYRLSQFLEMNMQDLYDTVKNDRSKMPITQFLERNVSLFPKTVALVEQRHEKTGAVSRKEMTWEELNAKANRFANALIERKIGKGSKVAILMHNCLDWLPIYLGILKTGAIAVTLNFRYDAEEIIYCLDLTEVDVMIFGPEFLERISLNASRIGNERILIGYGLAHPTEYAEEYEEIIASADDRNPGVKIEVEDDAAIYFSSGTTGFPKAILHKHRNLTQAAEMEEIHHNITKDDNYLLMPPMYHCGSKIFWLGNLINGSKCVILIGSKAKTILETISKERVTMAFLLVPWAQDIIDAIDSGEINIKDYDLQCWRLMHLGAQPIPPSLVKRWRELFPWMQYDTTYGLTEATGPNCMHLGVENVDKVGSIGRPGYRWAAKIVDAEGKPVSTGEIGELCVKGPGIMSCYYNNPKATAQAIIDGWLYTGDMAKQDEEGFYYLVDRKKDLIVCGGENIYPVQIEDFLHKNENIKDVAVIGLEDRRLGERIAAIIELKPGVKCTKEDIEHFCEGLPRYKRPKEIIFDDVPRNPTGKLEKVKLRAKYGVDQLVAKEYQN